MSLAAIRWAREQQAGGIVPKAALMALAEVADAEGRCYPSLQHLADRMECARATAKRAVRVLRDGGLITVRAEYIDLNDGGRRQLANTYWLTMTPGQSDPGSERPPGQSDPPPGSERPAPGVTATPQKEPVSRTGQMNRGNRGREGPNPAAVAARMERERRRREGEACEFCDDVGVRPSDDGTGMVDCDCKRGAA